MNNRKKSDVILILLGATLILVFVGVGWFVVRKKQPVTQSITQNENIKTSNDDIRKRHISQFATNLFNSYLIQKKSVSLDQDGFNSFSRLGSQEPALDPLTNNIYIFNAQQVTMSVGEVTFRLNASCDDKIEDSNGSGLIIDGFPKSVAVATKLESGRYECQSSL